MRISLSTGARGVALVVASVPLMLFAESIGPYTFGWIIGGLGVLLAVGRETSAGR